jgi:hypothetical protein
MIARGLNRMHSLIPGIVFRKYGFPSMEKGLLSAWAKQAKDEKRKMKMEISFPI